MQITDMATALQVTIFLFSFLFIDDVSNAALGDPFGPRRSNYSEDGKVNIPYITLQPNISIFNDPIMYLEDMSTSKLTSLFFFYAFIAFGNVNYTKTGPNRIRDAPSCSKSTPPKATFDDQSSYSREEEVPTPYAKKTVTGYFKTFTLIF